MSASKEYTEWHLTPQGWIAGTNRDDFKGTNVIEVPFDRVLTCKYLEEISNGHTPLHISADEIWSSGLADEILRLKKLHGECPRR
jgi:hypothetical protein